MKRLGLIICNNYIKELKTVIKQADFDGVETASLASTCFITSKCDRNKNRIQINKFSTKVDEIKLLLPKACGGIKTFSSNLNCSYVKMASCFEMIAPKEFIEDLIKKDNYIVTQAWISNWKFFVLKKWGFNQKNAKDLFRESAKQIVLLDSGVGKNAHQKLKEFAEFIDMKYQIIPIGLDYFSDYVKSTIDEL